MRKTILNTVLIQGFRGNPVPLHPSCEGQAARAYSPTADFLLARLPLHTPPLNCPGFLYCSTVDIDRGVRRRSSNSRHDNSRGWVRDQTACRVLNWKHVIINTYNVHAAERRRDIQFQIKTTKTHRKISLGNDVFEVTP